MTYDRPITISTAGSRKAIFWPAQSLLISELYARIATPARSSETYAEYMAMHKSQQDALKDVMELTNGDRAGKELSRELSRECYNFYNFISEYYIELDMECRDCEGSWEEDHSDIPFIRKYDDYSLQDYYDKNGKPIDRSRFRKNYKPHGK